MSSHVSLIQNPPHGRATLLPMLWQQTRSEFLILLRTPSFSITSLVLPVLLYWLIGLTGSGKVGGIDLTSYVLSSYATYGVVYVMLYSFGVRVAVERGQRMQVLMRTTPLPATISVLAKVLTTLTFTLIMLLLLAAFAILVAGVHLAVLTWISLIGRLLFGVFPFIALGLAIGYSVSPTAASPITSLIYVPLSFASGIFVPLNELPVPLQHLAPYLPMYRLAELGWNAVGAQTASPLDDLLWLLLYGLAFTLLAILALRRHEQRTFS